MHVKGRAIGPCVLALNSLEEEACMPEIYVYAAEGRSTEQKRNVAREITDSIVRHFAVPAEFVVVQFVEAARSSKARGGILFSEQGTSAPAVASATPKT